jgi:hypothetical protein
MVGSVFAAEQDSLRLSLLGNQGQKPFGETDVDGDFTAVDLSGISQASSDSGNDSHDSDQSAFNAHMISFLQTSEGKTALQKALGKNTILSVDEELSLEKNHDQKEPGKLSQMFGTCATPFNYVWNKYQGTLDATGNWFVKHPKVFAATDLASSLGMCVFANSYWFTQGTVFSVFATHLAAKSVNRTMPAKIGAPIAMGLYGAASYGLMKADLALDKEEADDSLNDNWVLQLGFEKVAALAGLIILDDGFAGIKKDIIKKDKKE